MGYLVDGKYVVLNDHVLNIDREIQAEMENIYEWRFGQKLTPSRYDGLSSKEQEWVAHNAMLRMQQRRKNDIQPIR